MLKRATLQLLPVMLAVSFVLVVRTVLAEPYSVPTPSMVPTLLVGDQLVGSKYAYGYSKYSLPIGQVPGIEGRLFGRAPERGDVVVFRLPRDPSTTYVKRLIGLPGDRIQMRHGRLYINDELVPRHEVGKYGRDMRYVETLPNGREHEIVEISDEQRHDETGVYVVPEGRYFMMGDNRDDSLDSRVSSEEGGVGYVPVENLVARVDRLLVSRNPDVDWLDVGRWAQIFRLGRTFNHID